MYVPQALKQVIKDDRANEEALQFKKQNTCSHEFRGFSLISGIKHLERDYYLCSSCNQTWDSLDEISPELRPKATFVGSVLTGYLTDELEDIQFEWDTFEDIFPAKYYTSTDYFPEPEEV